MRLHRFYTKENLGKGNEVRIEDSELIHQWTKVFRLKASDRVIIFNGNGKEFEGYFKILSKKEAVVFIDKENKVQSEIKTELHIFQSIIKKDNFELVVEKCTEIGASAFHPVISERSEKKDLNVERLKKIAKEASEQSGKVKLPEIFETSDLKSSIENFDGKLFVLDFDGEELDIKDEKVGVLIGPEGGWTENERDMFEHMDIKSFSLGSQILRAETAAIAASAIIMLN